MKHLRLLPFVGVLGACGQLTTTDDDGGIDASAPDVFDVTVPDVSIDVAKPEASVDGGADVGDGAKAKLDAPHVDLDAATMPWVATISNATIYSVAVDSNLNVLVGGDSNVSGYRGVVIAEYDSTGASLWSKQVGSSANGNGVYSVAFDSSGNMFAAGVTGESLNLGGGGKGPGAFIVKYDKNGNFVWEYGPFPTTVFTSVAVRSNGDILAWGTLLSGSEDYGGGTINANGRIVVLAELTSSKSFVGTKTWAGADQGSTGMTVDAWDDVYLLGRFAGSIDFGGGAMSGPTLNSGAYNNFIVELDSSSNYLYQMDTKTASNNDSVSAVSVDWNGNIFLTGVASTGINFGGATLSCGGAIGMLDQSFKHVWSKCYPNVSGFGLSVDPAGGVGYAGGYGNNANLGQGVLPAYHGAFLARFDDKGNSLASYGTGSTSNYFALGDNAHYLTWPDFIVVGTCSDTVTFPSGQITCPPNGAGFIARLAP